MYTAASCCKPREAWHQPLTVPEHLNVNVKLCLPAPLVIMLKSRLGFPKLQLNNWELTNGALRITLERLESRHAVHTPCWVKSWPKYLVCYMCRRTYQISRSGAVATPVLLKIAHTCSVLHNGHWELMNAYAVSLRNIFFRVKKAWFNTPSFLVTFSCTILLAVTPTYAFIPCYRIPLWSPAYSNASAAGQLGFLGAWSLGGCAVGVSCHRTMM